MLSKWTTFVVMPALACLAGAGWIVMALPSPVVPITVTQRVRMRSAANPAGTEMSRALVSAPGLTVAALRNEVTFPAYPGMHYRMLRYADGRKIDVHDLVRQKSTYPLPVYPAEDVASRMAAGCTHLGQRAGEEELGGLPVIRLRSVKPEAEVTYWVHVPSGCTELQSVWIWKKDGVEIGRTENRLETVHPGWADPALTRVPGDYREARPSAIRQAINNLVPGSTPASPRDERDDWAYAAAQGR